MIRLSEHYARTVEGHRLFRTKANRIEFLSTIHFLKEYLYPEKRMIELGSGHGVYARYFASNGYNILATDIVQSNIDKINELITPDIKEYIQTMQIDATQMDSISDNQFDITLCLGPLYHLRTQKERQACISETKRITKEKGIIAFAYINRNFAIPYTQSLGVKFSDKDFQEMLKTDWVYDAFPDTFMNISFYSTPELTTQEIKHSNLEIIRHVAIDGMYTMIKDQIEKLTEEEYMSLLNYHFHMADSESYLGSSGHNLIVCRNNKEQKNGNV